MDPYRSCSNYSICYFNKICVNSNQNYDIFAEKIWNAFKIEFNIFLFNNIWLVLVCYIGFGRLS